MLALTLTLILALGSGRLADIGPAPAVDLIDSAGRPFRLDALAGKVVVVSFVYTTCNGTCPLTTAALERTRRTLRDRKLWGKGKGEGKGVEFVSISLDPARDTPDVLRRYASIYRAEPDLWHFVTGPPDRVRAVLDAWDMWARVGPSGVIDHPSRIFLVDPAGRLREIYSLETLDPEALADDATDLLGEARRPDPAGRVDG